MVKNRILGPILTISKFENLSPQVLHNFDRERVYYMRGRAGPKRLSYHLKGRAEWSNRRSIDNDLRGQYVLTYLEIFIVQNIKYRKYTDLFLLLSKLFTYKN